LLKTHIPLQYDVKNATFFVNSKLTLLKSFGIYICIYVYIFYCFSFIETADELWKGVTTVSNAGRQRGRAKGLARKRDLNKGQIIGVGKIPIQFPGLNAPVFRGKELIQQQKLPVDPEREEKLVKLRQTQIKRRRTKLSPLERGWTGAHMGGRRIGPPDSIGEGYI